MFLVFILFKPPAAPMRPQAIEAAAQQRATTTITSI